jgi:hypothetical protein
MSMKRKYVAAVALGTLVVAVSAASCKCNKEEDLPPPPTAAPAPSAAPTLELAVEDAGADADADDGDAAKKATGTYNPGGLMACCNALAQNAKSAPPTQAPFMLQAAAACKAAAASGNQAGVNAALASAGKGACK